MKFPPSSNYLILYGTASLIAGILNKDILFWNIRNVNAFPKRWLNKEDWRYLNVVFGSLSLALGIFIAVFKR